MPVYASADAKKGTQSFSLDLSCSSVLSRLSYPGHHGAKQMFVHQNKWLGTAGRQQRLFCQQCCQRIGVATTSVSPLSLCFWVMLSWAQVWLRVRAINEGMVVQQQVTSAKLCAQRGRTTPGLWKFAPSSYKLPVTRGWRATDNMPWGNNVDCVYFCHHWLHKYSEAKFSCWTSAGSAFKEEPRELQGHMSES